MATKTRITVCDEEGAVFYVEARKKSEAWEKVKQGMLLRRMPSGWVSESVESTRRIDGSKFRYNDPANPGNFRATVKRYHVELIESGKCDFSYVVKKKEIV